MDNAAFQAARLAAAPGITPPQLTHHAYPLGDMNLETPISASRFTTRAVRPYAAYVEGKAEHTNELLEELQHENEADHLHDLLEELQEDPEAVSKQYDEVPSEHLHTRHRRVVRPRTFVHKDVEIHVQGPDEQERGPNESGEKKEDGSRRKETANDDGTDGAGYSPSETIRKEQAPKSGQIHIYPQADSVMELKEPSEEQQEKTVREQQ